MLIAARTLALTLAFFAASLGGSTGHADDAPSVVVAITDAMIFDGAGRAPYRGTVVINDGRIVEVGPDVRPPRGAQIIRARGRALLPGFIDVHTHWSPTGEPNTIPQIASRYVASGVTTVNDFHQQPESFEPRRAWLAGLVSPHVNFVARMSTPGGHGADWADTNTTRWVATPEAARREVRALQTYRPDFIKAFADGWRYGASPDNTSMNLATLAALVDEAHQSGQRVLTHTVTVDRGMDAARARVDVIAHSLQDREIHAEAVELIRSAGTFYAPTLVIYEPSSAARNNLGDPAAQQRVRKFGYAQHNLRTLHSAGVPIVLGTDAGIGGAQHGVSSLREMELLVEAGLSPEAALLAGTINSARALGLASDRGTIEAGKRADLVLINGTPWQDISDVRNIERVFIDGRQVFATGAGTPAANREVSLPPALIDPVIDDFERTDGRSSLDTLRLSDMDGGVDRSVVITNLITRPEGGYAMLVTARMALEDEALAGLIVPLRRGSVQPVDARRFGGVRLELRGEGQYAVTIRTLQGVWRADVEAGAHWRDVTLPFTAFTPALAREQSARSWRGDDLLQVGVEMRRPAGSAAWVELDNIRFY